MNEQSHIREALIQEIARYLAAVDLFRVEECEPTWRAESTLWPTMVACSRTSAQPAPSAHHCIRATDRSGNASPISCAKIFVK